MPPTNAPIPFLLWLAPVFALFEVWQLVLAERYMGVKQFARSAETHPRELGPSERTALVVVLGMGFNWLFMAGLVGSRFSRGVAVAMLLVSLMGLMARRQFGSRWWRRFSVRWALMVLTVEVALRLGLLGMLWRIAWRRL
jgi:hypothetical protein